MPDSPLHLLPEEQRLLAGCLAHDRQAQYQMYQRYKTAMFSAALRLLGGDHALAQDALQDAFVEVFQQLADFRQESTLGAWVKTIVVRRALRTLRRAQRTEVYDQDRHPEPLVAWRDGLTGEALDRAIGELPAGYRAVFCLVEGYAHREVAALFTISEGTSKSQLHHAKRRWYSFDRGMVSNSKNGVKNASQLLYGTNCMTTSVSTKPAAGTRGRH